MNELITMVTAVMFLTLGVLSGFFVGRQEVYEKYLEAKETCWQTHPVYVGDEENPIKFKCYEVTN